MSKIQALRWRLARWRANWWDRREHTPASTMYGGVGITRWGARRSLRRVVARSGAAGDVDRIDVIDWERIR